MLGNKIIKNNLYASCGLWLMSAFNFYLITFYLKYFPGNIFQSSIVFALSDMVGFFLSGMVLKYFKIGRGLRVSFIFSWTGGFLYMYLDKIHPSFLPVLICLSRVGCTMSYNIGYVSVPRLFPTRFVATVYGIVNVIAHVFACAAPLVAEIEDPYPFSFFLFAIFISLGCSYYLTELDFDKIEEDEEEDVLNLDEVDKQNLLEK